jgi:hypothetical protein
MDLENDVIAPLMEAAPPADLTSMEALKSLSCVEAWCDIVDIPLRRSNARAMAWLHRYCAEIYWRAQTVLAVPSTAHLNDGRPSPSFERVINSALQAARASGLVQETDLGEVYVLPIGTPNSIFTPGDGPTRRRVYFQTGMHECLDGLLRILCSIELALPIEDFEQLDLDGDTWQATYRELVKECLKRNPSFVYLGTMLVERLLTAGHPCETHRIPMLTPGVLLQRVLLRFVEVFRVGHEIAHAWMPPVTSEADPSMLTRIGGANVLVRRTQMEEEFAADMAAYGIVAVAIDSAEDPLPRELVEYALVAPDLALSLQAFVEQCLDMMGWRRPPADLHASAIERRKWRRKFLEDQNDLKLIALGVRFEIALTELQDQVAQEIHQILGAAIQLNPAWRGEHN